MDRQALVIGNSSYPGGRLPTTKNDAFDMAKALRAMDFKVDLRPDQTLQEMVDAVRDLKDRLTACSVGLFYFAGRGAQIQRRNYLIPLSEKSLTSVEIKYQAMALSFVLEELANAESWLNIVIIDASREQPIGLRNLAKGLAAEASPAAGTLIAYATAPGTVALGGTGRNDVFTSELLAALEKPDLEIEDIFKITREAVVESTNGLQVPWVSTSVIGQFVPRQALSEAGTNVCLDLLESTEPSNLSAGLRLGRVLWDGELIEPVLIWRNDEGDEAEYGFRNCSGDQSTENVNEAELFNSALVARFEDEEATLRTYRKVPYLDFESSGEAKLIFRDAGSMLEARRLDHPYVEVTGTDSVEIIPLLVMEKSVEESQDRETIAVLLVATREAMRLMEPEVWEKSWGDRPEDSLIDRQITWWELTVSPGKLRVHPAVESFEELTDLVDEPATENETDWSGVVDENLETILARAALSLLVAEEPEHVDLAEAMLQLATETNSGAELDVAKLEARRWKKKDLLRLKEAANRGRYWPLVRIYDLAAIMPDRIAGKIRRNYHHLGRSSFPGTRFTKEYVTLETNSRTFQVAHAVYQDQAAGMARMMSFLECLLQDAREMPSRLEVLKEGLERMDIPPGRLEEMDVRTTFRYLFQGLSLPAGLRAGERNFLRGISSGDPEVMRLVRSLQGSFDATSLDPGSACDVVLIPDAVLLGEPVDGPLVVVPSLPAPGDTEFREAVSLYDRAQRAKNKARIALKGAIYAKGAEHTKRKIEKGHKRLDVGNALLSKGADAVALKEAIVVFQEAETIFLEAKKTASRKEHIKPKIMVF